LGVSLLEQKSRSLLPEFLKGRQVQLGGYLLPKFLPGEVPEGLFRPAVLRIIVSDLRHVGAKETLAGGWGALGMDVRVGLLGDKGLVAFLLLVKLQFPLRFEGRGLRALILRFFAKPPFPAGFEGWGHQDIGA